MTCADKKSLIEKKLSLALFFQSAAAAAEDQVDLCHDGARRQDNKLGSWPWTRNPSSSSEPLTAATATATTTTSTTTTASDPFSSSSFVKSVAVKRSWTQDIGRNQECQKNNFEVVIGKKVVFEKTLEWVPKLERWKDKKTEFLFFNF